MSDKARERRLLDDAARRLGWQTRSVVPREGPDFEIHLRDGTLVGLELTETIDEDAAAGTHAMRRLCDDLEAELARRRVHLNVLLGFYWAGPNLISDTRTRQQYVRALTRVLTARLPDPGATIRLDQDDLEAAGAPHVQMLIASRGRTATVFWGHNRPGPGEPFLDARIREKDLLLPRYRESLPAAAQFWLLVVAGAHGAGAFLSWSAREFTYRTLFDRVFYLDLHDDVAFEVNTVPRTG